MPPIRADHGLSWRKGNSHAGVSAGPGDGDERTKQARRSTPLPKRHSPSHSRTPSPNQQAPSASGMATVHATTHGHVFAHGGARRSPSSKAGNAGSSSRSAFPDSVSGPREKRRASPDPARKGYAHAHVSQRGLGCKSPAFGTPFKGSSTRGSGGSSWGVSSPTPGVGGGRANCNSSPTPPAPSGGGGSGVGGSSIMVGRGHSSPTCGRGSDAADAQGQPPPCVGHASSALSFSALPLQGPGSAEVREMTPLDRVFLERPLEGRKNVEVEGDDLHLCNEIQRHLQSRVQSQQSQLMEATGGRAKASFGSAVTAAAASHQAQSVPDTFVGQEMELINDDGSCYSSDPMHDDPSISIRDVCRDRDRDPSSFASVPLVGGSDLLDVPDLGSAGVPPVSPSSGGGPAQGLMLDVGGSMDFLLDNPDCRSGGACDVLSGGGSGSPPGAGLTPDVQMVDAGDGQLREVVSGLDAMDLDDVDRALALLTAQKERIIAKHYAGVVAAAAHAEAQQSHPVLVPPQPPPQPQPASNGNGGSSSSRTGGGSSRHRRASGRSRHGSEGSPSAGGRSEAFGVSGGGVRGATTSGARASRGQGRPPPVPGHLSASTAAMRRSSPGSIASLAELDSYLEHHHRRLVENVEGVSDDVEAEIEASRQPRRATRSHQRFGPGPGSNGFGGSSSSSNSVPRTVGARVSTGSFFHSTLSADGDGNGHRAGWSGKGGRSAPRGWDPPPRGPGHKRERGELRGGGADGGWGAAGLRGFRSGGDDGDEDDRGSAFMKVSATTTITATTLSQTTASPPPSVMSSDDVSVSSYGPVTVLPGSPNNLAFAGRPLPSFASVRVEAVRSPVVRHGRVGRGRGGVQNELVFTSPDASKHVQELCSPRSAFTPRSASSVSSLASSPARRRGEGDSVGGGEGRASASLRSIRRV